MCERFVERLPRLVERDSHPRPLERPVPHSKPGAVRPEQGKVS